MFHDHRTEINGSDARQLVVDTIGKLALLQGEHYYRKHVEIIYNDRHTLTGLPCPDGVT